MPRNSYRYSKYTVIIYFKDGSNTYTGGFPTRREAEEHAKRTRKEEKRYGLAKRVVVKKVGD